MEPCIVTCCKDIRILTGRIEAKKDHKDETKVGVLLLKCVAILTEIAQEEEEKDEKVLSSQLRQMKKNIGRRFSNYKTEAPLPLHYSEKHKMELIQKFSDYRCPGRATSKDKKGEGGCDVFVTTTSFLKNTKILVFDHHYEQDSISNSMNLAIGWLESTAEFIKEFPEVEKQTSYIKKYWGDNPRKITDLQKKLKMFVEKRIDLEKYSDDLYGSNLIPRCTRCDSNAVNCHPAVDWTRYIKLDEDIKAVKKEMQLEGWKI